MLRIYRVYRIFFRSEYAFFREVALSHFVPACCDDVLSGRCEVVYPHFSRRFRRMQVIRLPDSALLLRLLVAFIVLIGCLTTVQIVDPMHAATKIEQGKTRDEQIFYCTTGSVGVALLALLGVGIVSPSF